MRALPVWFTDLTQEKVFLLLNHLLAAQTGAQARLRSHAGRSLRLSCYWPAGQGGEGVPRSWWLTITPAGLLEPVSVDAAGASATAPADLVIELRLESWGRLMQILRAGQRPPVQLAGDAAMASDVSWVIDHLRWDWEDDLHRWFGPWVALTAGRLAQAAGPLKRRWRRDATRSETEAKSP